MPTNAHGEQPRAGSVQCISPSGLHRMRYVEWGDPHNERVLVCVHGLTRCGRDFDHLARALCGELRVICPDVVGRGLSDWLRDPKGYQFPQYVADMVSLIARLDVEKVSWLGTSMGGLIGIGLAGLPDTPIQRLVLNDVGPRAEPAFIARLGEYLGRPMRFANLEQAVEYNRLIASGFAMRSDEEWREVTASVLKPDGDGFVFRYDPAISIPIKAMPAAALAGAELVMWSLYDAIQCPTMVLRGANSDVLTEPTAIEMSQRGPKPPIFTVPGVGHAPMFFDPAQIEAVRGFLLQA